MSPKIALIHATPLAMEPIQQAFLRHWPQAECMNLLDDGLSKERGSGDLSAGLAQRIVDLAVYAQNGQANALLYTCSAFAPAIDRAAAVTGLPTLKPNQAMFEEALRLCQQMGGTRKVGLLTSFAPALTSMRQEWQDDMAARAGAHITLHGVCAEGAMQALGQGDAQRHDQMLLQAASQLSDCDVLMLGQFSMARAQPFLHEALQRTVLSSPDSAVLHLKNQLPG
jgi:Asp/Glu/hydantoin racemase